MGRLLSLISRYENEVEAEVAGLAEKHTFALDCCLKHLQQIGLTSKELNAVTLNALNLQEDK